MNGYGLVLSFLALVMFAENLHSESSCHFNPSFLESTCSSQYHDLAAKVIEDVLVTLAEEGCELASPCSYPPSYTPEDGEWFDFIIVGAGSAGSVLANRLSEVTSWKVLLLEAGGNPTKTSEVPSFCDELQLTEIDWQFKTSPEELNCLGCKDSRCNWPRGKVLGGSSTINCMQYMRGNARDYDGWEDDGCVGWGYDDVLPYFKKLENIMSPEILASPEFSIYHNVGGNVQVEDYITDFEDPLARVFAEGAAILGYPTNYDVNGRVQTGFNKFRGTLRDGRRCSTAKAYLSPIINRNNFQLTTKVIVTKILIDEVQRRAYGIEFLDHTRQITQVFARKEVIISAGSINSPQLLMLSGIGPGRHLHSLGIKVLADLPVGFNLHDHSLAQGLIMTVDYHKPTANQTLQEDMIRFLMKKRSRLSGIGMDSFNVFVNTESFKDDYPDVDLLFEDFAQNDASSLKQYLDVNGYIDEIQKQYLEINAHSYIVLPRASLLKPYSRGRIELQSKDPLQHPKIIAGYFSNPRDIDTLINAYNFFYNFVETEPLKAINAKLYEVSIPACLKFPLRSREYRDCFIRFVSTTQYHPVGTCRMGSPNRPETVVDPALRVKGIQGLRVIDASVMPFITRGNTNAPTIMIGEKGSDLIKEFWFALRNRTPYSRKDHFNRLFWQ